MGPHPHLDFQQCNAHGVILPRPVLESWGVGEGEQLEVTDKGVRPRRKGGLPPKTLDELKRSIALAVVRDFAPAQISAQILLALVEQTPISVEVRERVQADIARDFAGSDKK
jgi:hypothetical protein